MAELFSREWAALYQQAWNYDKEIQTALLNSNFTALIGFGITNEIKPRFMMMVEKGMVIAINNHVKGELDWDIRAKKDDWHALIIKPPGLMRLGIAYTSRKIRFMKGDYASMIKDPQLATAFVKSFALMGKIL